MLAVLFFKDPLTLFTIGLTLLILFFWYFATEIETRKRNVGTVLLVGICGLCASPYFLRKSALRQASTSPVARHFSCASSRRKMQMVRKCR